MKALIDVAVAKAVEPYQKKIEAQDGKIEEVKAEIDKGKRVGKLTIAFKEWLLKSKTSGEVIIPLQNLPTEFESIRTSGRFRAEVIAKLRDEIMYCSFGGGSEAFFAVCRQGEMGRYACELYLKSKQRSPRYLILNPKIYLEEIKSEPILQQLIEWYEIHLLPKGYVKYLNSNNRMPGNRQWIVAKNYRTYTRHR